MYFYHGNFHESYRDAYYTDAGLKDFTVPNRRDDHPTYEPIMIVSILKWPTTISVALITIFSAIHHLS